MNFWDIKFEAANQPRFFKCKVNALQQQKVTKSNIYLYSLNTPLSWSLFLPAQFIPKKTTEKYTPKA